MRKHAKEWTHQLSSLLYVNFETIKTLMIMKRVLKLKDANS